MLFLKDLGLGKQSPSQGSDSANPWFEVSQCRKTFPCWWGAQRPHDSSENEEPVGYGQMLLRYPSPDGNFPPVGKGDNILKHIESNLMSPQF